MIKYLFLSVALLGLFTWQLGTALDKQVVNECTYYTTPQQPAYCKDIEH